MFNTFFRKSCPLSDNVEKYGTARQATDDNTGYTQKNGAVLIVFTIKTAALFFCIPCIIRRRPLHAG
jgi:hypothetical protein